MENYVHSSLEAMEEYTRWDDLLTEAQKTKFLSSTLSKDGNEWCIFSGSNLTSDRAGFGSTITTAVQDYMSIYNQKKIAS